MSSKNILRKHPKQVQKADINGVEIFSDLSNAYALCYKDEFGIVRKFSTAGAIFVADIVDFNTGVAATPIVTNHESRISTNESSITTINTTLTGHDTRITTLEDTKVKTTNFEVVTTTSGSITKPSGSTILLDEFEGTVDAILSKIDGSNTPTWELVRDAGGTVVAVSTFDTAGNYTLTGTPTDASWAILYVYETAFKDFDSDESLGFELIKYDAAEIKALYESNSNTNAFTDRASDIVDGYIHTQGVASATWNINHNLAKFPSVMIVDSGNNVVWGCETYDDNNNITITFGAPFTGKAYLT